MDFILSQVRLAKLFQCSTKTIRNFTSQGMPQLSSGQFDIRACTPWLLKQKQGPNRKSGTGDAYLALLQEQTEACRLKTAEARESLVERHAATEILEYTKSAAARNLEAMLERSKSTFPGSFGPIETEVRDAIESIACFSPSGWHSLERGAEVKGE